MQSILCNKLSPHNDTVIYDTFIFISAMPWTKDQKLDFYCIFKESRILYDPNYPNYKNFDKRKETYEIIAAATKKSGR